MGTNCHSRYPLPCYVAGKNRPARGILKKFRDAGIPVLWRPYHEMNGMWFWYGNRPGEKGIQKLWKMMYDRYVNYHHLNNLIWVWNANAPRDWKDDEAYAYELFIPVMNMSTSLQPIFTKMITSSHIMISCWSWEKEKLLRWERLGYYLPLKFWNSSQNGHGSCAGLISVDAQHKEQVRELYNSPRVITKEK